LTEAGLRFGALDLGAESGRAVVGRFDGARLDLGEAHRFRNVPVRLGDTLYWDFPRLFGDVLDGLRLARAGGPLASVAVDTWGVDFGLLDGRGRLVSNPVHYRDSRTEGIVETACRLVPREEIYRATGIQFMPINTLFQLLAMLRGGDPSLAAADRLLMMGDLFAHFLAGTAVAEHTNATTSQCLDPRTGEWAFPLLERFGIPKRLFPPIVEPGTRLGPVRTEVARAAGVDGTVVVAPASHDTASAVVGTPLGSPATAFLSSGTWSLIGLELPRPVIDDASLAANLTNEGGFGGTTRLLRNVMGLWLVQESRRARWSAGDAPGYDELAVLAARAPSRTAFIDPDDERFLRPGDLPARIREACRETGQPAPQDDATLFRVIHESLALRYAAVLDDLARAVGHPIEAIQVVGGGANDELLCQLTADATGLPVGAGPVEATAIGNVAVQAIAAGELDGVADARAVIAASFPIRRYEPAGDWSGERARFAALLAGREPTSAPQGEAATTSR
jgi:rhamnulokinase